MQLKKRFARFRRDGAQAGVYRCSPGSLHRLTMRLVKSDRRERHPVLDDAKAEQTQRSRGEPYPVARYELRGGTRGNLLGARGNSRQPRNRSHKFASLRSLSPQRSLLRHPQMRIPKRKCLNQKRPSLIRCAIPAFGDKPINVFFGESETRNLGPRFGKNVFTIRQFDRIELLVEHLQFFRRKLFDTLNDLCHAHVINLTQVLSLGQEIPE